MRFYSLYRISLYALLALSTLILNLDAESIYARMLPALVAVCAAVAFLSVDRSPGGGLSPWTANLLGIAALALVYVEYQSNNQMIVLAAGHSLVYLTLIKLFRPKTAEDDWFLLLLGVMQVLVGGFLSQSDFVGVLLITWALLALWVLGLFYLCREADRAGLHPADSPEEPYPGLLSREFFVTSARGVATTFLLGAFIFLLMPRSGSPQQSGGGGGQSSTGFSEQVRLGQLGEILESDRVVMTVELFDAQGRKQSEEPAEEPLWRGVALSNYDDGSWTREADVMETSPRDEVPGRTDVIEQQIRLENWSSPVVFGMRPVLSINPQETFKINGTDGTLFVNRDGAIGRGRRRRDTNLTLSYTVRSEVVLPGELRPQPGETLVSIRESMLRDLDPELMARLKRFSDPVVASISPDDILGRVRALERFLSSSGQFTYTLTQRVVDPQLDPVLDFLENRKSGHCEYFASALALLIRSQEIPCRVINGFKGGDWNELSSSILVRQKHAHSWVEAFVGLSDDSGARAEPIWVTLDPSPPAEREETVARVSGWPTSLRQASDFMRYIWVFYIAGFNAQRQERILYGPIRALFTSGQSGFRFMAKAARNALRWMTDFPSPRDFFSLRGFVASTMAMLLVALALRVLSRVGRWILDRLRGPHVAGAETASALAFYRRLVQFLQGLGYERAPQETPREFAQRTERLLGTRLQDRADLAEVPAGIVSAYYDVRFGGMNLAPGRVEQLTGQLDALEAYLAGPNGSPA